MPEPTPLASHARISLPTPASASLTGQVIVQVSGPAVDKFLHGQFSQSMDEVTDTRSPRAAACNPKGRAYALTRLVRHDDSVLLAFPASLADAIVAHLNKYLMLFRGTNMAVLEDAGIVGLFGNDLAEQLAPGITPRLLEPGDTARIGAHTLIRTQDTASGLVRYEFWRVGPLSESEAATIEAAYKASETDWQASEIAAGIAALCPATQDAYVPQMLNWQHVDGIHFKKGCYTGQEVIARMHFLGQLKKSLFRLRAEPAESALIPGQQVLAGERVIGEIVSSVAYDNHSAEALAVLRHEGAGHPLTLKDPSATPLQLLDLPYSVPERQKTDVNDT
ncbi:YgfZ/GcvT domain-containing protein [Marinobacter caseinilyticus]|uniref:CAF17-like 4Fe-4S cluster assembly/insertion protein YgfZ n=1 Tax=Marinobacter caseinilyticus TaxID=2692195 RepID=UPI00140D64B0|nr:folate-binding protein YgfZ [Marinobacter caseinilyticus]